jgi:cytochrome c oxidase assembly factor CtaG
VVAPSTQALLTQWSWEPSVLIGLAALGGAYFYAVGPLRRRRAWGPPVSRTQVTYFVLAEIILIVSLLSPLDVISDEYLFSGHMVQHLLLATLWPPLMLMATPVWLARRIVNLPVVSALVTFLVYPAIALLTFNIDVYLWHLPALYDATLSNAAIHIVEHLSFMFFGLVNWWPVLSPIPEQRLSSPLQILYLIADGMFMMVLGILFTFAPDPFYAPYTRAPRLWDISASTDQQIGGLIMWYPGNVPYAILLVVAFYRWFDSADPDYLDTQPISSPTIDSPVP